MATVATVKKIVSILLVCAITMIVVTSCSENDSESEWDRLSTETPETSSMSVPSSSTTTTQIASKPSREKLLDVYLTANAGSDSTGFSSRQINCFLDETYDSLSEEALLLITGKIPPYKNLLDTFGEIYLLDNLKPDQDVLTMASLSCLGDSNQ